MVIGNCIILCTEQQPVVAGFIECGGLLVAVPFGEIECYEIASHHHCGLVSTVLVNFYKSVRIIL